MARYILGTEVLADYLRDPEGSSLLGARQLSEVAVSALTFEAISAEIELSKDLTASARAKWRTNLHRFRELLIRGGGQVPALTHEVIVQWGRLQILDLLHPEGPSGNLVEMSTEERLIAATAAAEGFVYLTYARDWNAVIEAELGVAIAVV